MRERIESLKDIVLRVCAQINVIVPGRTDTLWYKMKIELFISLYYFVHNERAYFRIASLS